MMDCLESPLSIKDILARACARKYLRSNLAKVHRITIPPPGLHEPPTPASTVAFDTQQELLWIGNEYVSRSFPHFSKPKPKSNIIRVVLLLFMDQSCEDTPQSRRTLPRKVLSNIYYSMRRASSRSRPTVSTCPQEED